MAASRKVADLSNQLIFGSEQLLPKEKLQVYKPRYTVSVEVAKKRAMQVVKELPELQYVERAIGDNFSKDKDKDISKCVGKSKDNIGKASQND